MLPLDVFPNEYGSLTRAPVPPPPPAAPSHVTRQEAGVQYGGYMEDEGRATPRAVVLNVTTPIDFAPLAPAPAVPPPPPAWHTLLAGERIPAGLGHATVLPDFDFETYSEAGHVWLPTQGKWAALPGASQGKKGLFVVGAAAYAEHPSTEVLSLYYDLKDGTGRHHWRPGMAPPFALFAHVLAGGLLEAWNSGFEYWIWTKVCMPKYGWPPLQITQLRCAMAKGRAFALPGALGKVGDVLNLVYKKDPRGDALIKKFSVPRNPTKKDPRTRIRLDEDEDGPAMVSYNERDIVTEAEASSRIPDLSDTELAYWIMDQEINRRGVRIDVAAMHNCIAIIEQAHELYNRKLYVITGGVVARASELAKLKGWLRDAHRVHADEMDEEALDAMLARTDLPPAARRALEIRQLIGSAAVKKVFAMRNSLTAAGRVHDLFNFCGARTGRTTGEGAQPTNMPNSGPDVCRCGACRHHFAPSHEVCPWCFVPQPPGKKARAWGTEAVVDALAIIAGRDLGLVEHFFGHAMAAVSGCLRGLFIADEGKELICSDYSAIEAVVLAKLAGVPWREEVFRTHGKIYEASAAKITGIPFEEFMRHYGYTDAELALPDWYTREPITRGSHHPMRKKIGKVAELASGFQGWIGSWKAFGAEEFLTEQEMKEGILAWRAASPEIVEYWGGQFRGQWESKTPELYGVEGMFIAAMTYPGQQFEFRGIKFKMHGDAVYLTLLSGRSMVYHAPRLEPSDRGGWAISFEGYNTNPKNGPVGWVRMRTWGGRLTENIVQATARDIQWHGMLNLKKAGYPIVLHVYDEDIAEVPIGYGSIEEFEAIMATLPAWAAGWPIKASGGWRGPRYNKGE